jgi:hypothetical protein
MNALYVVEHGLRRASPAAPTSSRPPSRTLRRSQRLACLLRLPWRRPRAICADLLGCLLLSVPSGRAAVPPGRWRTARDSLSLPSRRPPRRPIPSAKGWRKLGPVTTVQCGSPWQAACEGLATLNPPALLAARRPCRRCPSPNLMAVTGVSAGSMEHLPTSANTCDGCDTHYQAATAFQRRQDELAHAPFTFGLPPGRDRNLALGRLASRHCLMF